MNDGERHFHEDCWKSTHPDSVAPAPSQPAAAAEPLVEQLVEQRVPAPAAEQLVEQLIEQRVPEPAAEQIVPEPAVREASSEQRDYEQRIASGGLAALLSPYVSGLPVQRKTEDSVPA